MSVTGKCLQLLVTLLSTPVLKLFITVLLVLDAVTTRSRAYENTKTFGLFDTV